MTGEEKLRRHSRLLVVLQNPVGIEGGRVVHLLHVRSWFGTLAEEDKFRGQPGITLRSCSNNKKASAPHHCHPADGRDALTDGRQVVEEAAAAVSLPESLDLLDVIRNGLQQVAELRLHEEEDKEEEEEEKEEQKKKERKKRMMKKSKEVDLDWELTLKRKRYCRGICGFYIWFTILPI